MNLSYSNGTLSQTYELTYMNLLVHFKWDKSILLL